MTDQQPNYKIQGNNVLRFNAITIMAAIEYWLNEQVLKKPVTVVDVRARSNGGVFEVEITEKNDQP